MEATFAADPRAPARARAFVGAALESRACSRHALLAVSELVTNVVLHDTESTELTVSLHVLDDLVRMAVAGTSAKNPTISRHPNWPSPDDADGRGLIIVEAVAERWGVETTEAPTVWCELAC